MEIKSNEVEEHEILTAAERKRALPVTLTPVKEMIQSQAKQQIYFLLSQLLEYKVIIIISKDSSHKRYKINLVK